MANVLYNKWKEALIQASANSSLTGTVNALLIDAGAYTFSQTDEFLTSVPGGARIGTAVALASKTFVNGVFDAADINFVAVPGPTSVEALILYVSTGVDATSRLVLYVDTATGLPFTPSGVDQPVVWNASGIFSL